MAIIVGLTPILGSGNDDLLGSWGQGSCGAVDFYDVTLFKDGSPYFNINQTQLSYEFLNLPAGEYYLTISANFGGSECDNGTSATILVTPDEVPIEPTPPPAGVIPANIYDNGCPRFLLVKNMTDRFFEGDVVDMSLYDYTEVDEPIGFSDATFKLERDEMYHGFLYEFSDDGLKFERNSVGYDYLKAQLFTDGLDVDIKFVYGYGAIATFTIMYIGKVDTSEYGEIEDGDKVEFGLKELDFDTLLQTAMEVVQPTAPDIDVLLYSKVIPKQVAYRVPRREQIEAGGIESTYPSAVFNESVAVPPSGINYIYINDGREGDDDLEIFTTYDFQLDNDAPNTATGDYKYILRAKLAGKYTFRVKVLLRLEYNNSVGEPTLDVTRLKVLKTEEDGETLIGSESTYAPTILNVDPPTDGFIDCLFDEDITLDIDLDNCVYLYFQTLTAGSAELFNIGIRPFPSDSNLPELTVEVQTLAPASKGKFIRPLDLLESTFSQAAEVGYTIVSSDFFNTLGCGEKLVMTNGFGIRGFQDGDRTYIKTSAKKLIDSLLNLFCLGWGVEYNISKQEIVRVEPVEYFYQDAEIIAFTSVSNYEKRIDPSKYYNEFEVGFAKYSKERETDKGNTLDDFHTKHLYQSPIKTNKNKMSVITDLTLSGYEIEILRRKQFEKDGSNINGNFREDEELFGVQLVDFTLYSGDTYTGYLTDLTEGDIINLTTSYMIVVGYAYFYTGQQIDVNVDSQGNVRTTIAKVQYGYFTPTGFGFPVLGTLIRFSSSIDTPVLPVTASVTISLVDGESYYVPESTQPFGTISNMIAPETGYNIRYTPKRMLYNWAKLFNGGFFGKVGTEQIVFKQGDGNVELSTQFNVGEPCPLGDVDKEVIAENSNVQIANIYNRGFLFLPIKVSFSANLSFEQLTTIKDCLRGRADYNNYGYVSVTNSCGEVEKVYLTSVTYNPIIDEAEFEGYLKEI